VKPEAQASGSWPGLGDSRDCAVGDDVRLVGVEEHASRSGQAVWIGRVYPCSQPKTADASAIFLTAVKYELESTTGQA
jgi:hypothetical protein